MDYEKNIRYFTPVTYGGPTFLIIVGAVLILAAFGTQTIWFGLIGTLLIALGILWRISKKKKIVTDMDYDRSVFEGIGDLKARALSRLGVDEDEVSEIPPITLDSYSFDGANLGRIGVDGKWRTNQYKCIMLLFSANEVHCYTYQFSTTTNAKTEATDVYFYRDIVSASTASENITFLGRTINNESFKLTTAGGTSISVNLRNDETAQQSINAMRAVLKEKKQTMH